ncbi:UvrABC system protein A [Streptomyces sp. YIM 121038]|uniref:flavin reductase n=1 Tax=Streptomyces sp. YIM 121038 TaxID=2136401 RepID=UPI0011100777|nr:flavin reductase [Streptomyces sp. YIM 121038]QCX80812.1 UvrABC system protein A [Streptomyces sp. YIM 121038]
MGPDSIVLEGVATHNLKSVDVSFPKGKLVVAVGVSGSGKSSLVIDTLFEHSKSLYLGALSSKSLDMGDGDYQFDRIAGTQPPVALRQRDGGLSNPRSTVGTLTGLDGLYRLLFGAGSRPVCPACLGPTKPDLFCDDCGCFAEPHTARHFSPNRKEGKCLHCDGVGEIVDFSLEKIIPDPSKTLREIWDNADPGTFAIPNVRKVFEAMAADTGLDLDTPYESLSPEQCERVLHGTDTVYTIKVRKVTNDFRFEGILGFLQRSYKNTSSASRRNAFTNYLGKEPCSACAGGRLRPESLKATVAGHTFHDFQSDELSHSIARLRESLSSGGLPPQVRELATAIVKQSANIVEVGLGHLHLQRPVATLSGGELQRLLLAQHLASDLTGVMYVLDEPTAGLHESDTGRLLTSLRRLRDLGNTVIVIEHDETVIRAADWIVELGPGAGSRGGEVVFEGRFADLLRVGRSPTAAALLSRAPSRTKSDLSDGAWLEVRDISRNNVVREAARFPVGGLTCVSGVSGAGKSSLVAGVHDAVSRAIARRVAGVADDSADVTGAAALDEVIHVEQRAIGRSSRSTLVTYIGIGDHIRDAFAASADAAERGLSRAQFSPNVPGGRCEACKGLGLSEIEMTLFKSEFIVCPECEGRKFQDHVLDVRLRGSNIHDVLSMTVEDALGWFEPDSHPKVAQALTVLNEFGLGYLQLGCATTTLSGGEAQRLNLASELLTQRRSRTLFIFDEPTRGLHAADIRHLLTLFERLLSTGNTIIVIEHHTKVISIADWVVDLGPGAGGDGGRVIHCGTPEDLADNPHSSTGQYVRELRDGVGPPVHQPQAADASGAVEHARPGAAPDLRGLAKLLPLAITVVAGTKRHAEQNGSTPYGLVIGSLTVVSEELALIGFLVRSRSTSWSAIAGEGRLCVNVLDEQQTDVAAALSQGRPDSRFEDLSWTPSANGCPRLSGAFGTIDCSLESAYQLGDHEFVLAKAVSVDMNPQQDRRPLLRTGPPDSALDAYGWRRYDEEAGVR